MLRVTMISTMPVAMIAMDVLCTDRFHRFLAVRKSPCDSRWKATQMAISASTMPIRRVSNSIDETDVRQELAGCGVVLLSADVFGVSTVDIAPPGLARCRTVRTTI